MTLATICRSVAIRVGVPPADVWTGNTDETAREIVEFVGEALRTVAEAHDWEALNRTHEAEITSDTLQTVALPADCERILPETVWIDGDAMPVKGPLTEPEFEALRQDVATSTTPVFRLSGGAMELLGPPAPGGALSFRYVSSQPVVAADATRREAWLADSDTTVLNERLITLAAIVLWRDAKGLPAPVAMAQYAGALARAKAADRPIGVLDLAGRRSGCDVRGRDPIAVLDAVVLG